MKKRTSVELTYDLLVKLLEYDPETGYFYWKQREEISTYWTIKGARIHNVNHAGKKAGCVKESYEGLNYLVIRILNKLHRAHRVAFLFMTKEWPKNTVDHINGDSLDNRWNNLRDVPHKENMKNVRRRKDNTTGVTGVTRRRGKWKVQIFLKDKCVYTKDYSTLKEATEVRLQKQKEFGFHKNHGREV